MARYADNHGTHRTLTDAEVFALLTTTGERKGGFRDHCLFALALSTGLREKEILALNHGDVFTPEGGVRRLVILRVFKGSGREGAERRKDQEVRLSEGLRSKLKRLRKNLELAEVPIGDDDPVFVSNRKTRLSARMVRVAFKTWQKKADFEREFSFHDLRHTAITNAYRRSGGDIVAARRFGRHAHITTTQRYAHASDERLFEISEMMPC